MAPVRVRVCRYTPSGSESDSDSSELTASCFPLLLLVMFAVSSGYSMSEKTLLLWERLLLADGGIEVSCLTKDCWCTLDPQRHSESMEMSRWQQQDEVTWWALLFFVK